jgi:CRISPR-associated protein Cmr1
MPLFLSGANQQEAELRPPAFRGALRYWFRAIAGPYYWNNPNQLKKIESDILGDSGSHCSSKIILRLSKVPNTESEEIEFNQQGINYLWFSLKAQKSSGI